jgi:hypothetical protein
MLLTGGCIFGFRASHPYSYMTSGSCTDRRQYAHYPVNMRIRFGVCGLRVRYSAEPKDQGIASLCTSISSIFAPSFTRPRSGIRTRQIDLEIRLYSEAVWRMAVCVRPTHSFLECGQVMSLMHERNRGGAEAAQPGRGRSAGFRI